MAPTTKSCAAGPGNAFTFTATALLATVLAACSSPTVPAGSGVPATGGGAGAPTVAGAIAQLPRPMIGANVDMANLLPTDSLYVRTDRGDLFDYAHALGLNAFRVTVFEEWGLGSASRAFTPAEWNAVAARARATGVVLIPVVALTAKQRGDVGATAAGSARLQAEERDLTATADSMLGPGGLAALAAQGRMILDMGNEPSVEPDTVAMYQAVIQQVHASFPGVPVTVGGWHTVVTGPNGSVARFNNPADGVPYGPLDDVVSVHAYNVVMNGTNGRGLQNLPPDSAMSATTSYLAQVVPWAGGKPILVEEWGAASGNVPVASVDPGGQPYTPARQLASVQAMLQGMGAAASNGVQLLGATAWILTPRGPQARFNSTDNGMSLLFLRGAGQPLNPMPALGALCSGAAAWPSGGSLQCGSLASAGTWVQQSP